MKVVMPQIMIIEEMFRFFALGFSCPVFVKKRDLQSKNSILKVPLAKQESITDRRNVDISVNGAVA